MLGDGDDFGANFHYTVQPRPDGIAGALGLARWFVGEEPFVVCLGDNIFEAPMGASVESWDTSKAKVLVTEVDNPKSYGILETEPELKIVEKPENPVSNLAVTGLYMYPFDVFEYVDQLEPSARQELEITDVNNSYIEQGRLEYEVVEGLWLDAGESIDALIDAGMAVRQRREAV